jgi:hypothetical protein
MNASSWVLRCVGAVLLLTSACARSTDAWRDELLDPEAPTFDRGLAAIALAESPGRSAADLGGVPTALLGTLDLPESSLATASNSALLELPPSALPELGVCLAQGTFGSSLAQAALEAAIVRHGGAAIPAILDTMPPIGSAGALRFGKVVLGIGEPAAAPLAENLSAGDRGVKAAFLLGSLGHKAATSIDALLAAAGGEDRALALRAIESLAYVDPEGGRAEPVLRSLIGGGDPERRAAAEETFARVLLDRARKLEPASADKKRLALLRDAISLGQPSGGIFADALWREGSPRARFAADALLGSALRWSLEPRARAAPDEAIRSAAKRLRGGTIRDRRRAALEIGPMGRGAVDLVPELADALKNGDWGLRFCVEISLALVAVDLGRTAAAPRG